MDDFCIDPQVYAEAERLADFRHCITDSNINSLIGAELNGKNTTFFVRDNGIGIDPQYKDKFFGLFEKPVPTSKGTELRLALIKRIVELYEGKILMESEGSGKRTSFRFTLPGAVNVTRKGEVL